MLLTFSATANARDEHGGVGTLDEQKRPPTHCSRSAADYAHALPRRVEFIYRENIPRFSVGVVDVPGVVGVRGGFGRLREEVLRRIDAVGAWRGSVQDGRSADLNFRPGGGTGHELEVEHSARSVYERRFVRRLRLVDGAEGRVEEATKSVVSVKIKLDTAATSSTAAILAVPHLSPVASVESSSQSSTITVWHRANVRMKNSVVPLGSGWWKVERGGKKGSSSSPGIDFDLRFAVPPSKSATNVASRMKIGRCIRIRIAFR